MLTVKDLKDLKGKTVVVRVDFNVPLKGGEIRDDNRIVAALPTIQDLLGKGARLVLMSHLGKIKHKEAPEVVEEMKKKNDMAPVAARLEKLLGQKVYFCPLTRGDELTDKVNSLKDGEVLLMQNTRYEKGEEKNDPELAKIWASFADAYVMDAFGSAHRAHASTYGIPAILKEEGKPVAVGYLVEKEVAALTRCVDVKDTDRPYVAVLGGLKVSDKIKVIDSLLKKCDKILIGGAMAFTFIKALGGKVGESPVEDDQLQYAKNCYEAAHGNIILPVDTVAANGFDNWTEIVEVDSHSIPDGFEGLDIGPRTAALFKDELKKAKMVFWNGPMGVFEQDSFQSGTIAICEAIQEIPHSFTVCGGGDSAAAIKQFGFVKSFSHVSTGGGASLEMIENDGHLPGIDIIR